MSQNDFTIANQGFPAFRADLNSALQALASNNSGATEPSTMFANMWWYDSANNIMYIRNEDNDAWIKFAELDQTNDKFVLSGTLQLDDGTVSAPALTFNSDTNMGIYRGGTDILKFVTAGTDAITIDASQDVTLAGSLTFADNEKALFGAGSDLQISHDGSNSYIKEVGDGGLIVQASTSVSLQGTNTSNLATFFEGGSASLYHNNAQKLATSSTGIQVTGDIANASGDLTLDVAGDITLDADGGDINFKDGGVAYGNFLLSGSDFTIGSSQNNGDLIFRGIDGGANVTALTLDMSDAGTAIFNNRIRGASASDGSPTYSFDTDSHTGMFNPANDNIGFSTGGTERIRISSSGMLMLNGVNEVARFVISQDTQALNMCFLQNTNGTFGGNYFSFANASGVSTGTINQTGSTTVAYNTSSDYRLKENVNYDFDATSRLKQLKPARFNWIEDETNTLVDGFLAHEVSSIVPEAITGEKDATKDVPNVVLHADGTVKAQGISEEDWKQGKSDGIYANDTTWVASKTIIDAQGIDQSKLVPLLVKTIQELEARITALETA